MWHFSTRTSPENTPPRGSYGAAQTIAMLEMKDATKSKTARKTKKPEPDVGADQRARGRAFIFHLFAAVDDAGAGDWAGR